MSARRFRILVCRGPECGDRRESRGIYEAFRGELDRAQMLGTCELGWQSCFGRCSQGPNALVREIRADAPPPRFALATLPGPRGATALYNRLDVGRVRDIVRDHVGRGMILRSYIEAPAPAIALIEDKPPKGDRE